MRGSGEALGCRAESLQRGAVAEEVLGVTGGECGGVISVVVAACGEGSLPQGWGSPQGAAMGLRVTPGVLQWS